MPRRGAELARGAVLWGTVTSLKKNWRQVSLKKLSGRMRPARKTTRILGIVRKGFEFLAFRSIPCQKATPPVSSSQGQQVSLKKLRARFRVILGVAPVFFSDLLLYIFLHVRLASSNSSLREAISFLDRSRKVLHMQVSGNPMRHFLKAIA